MSAVIEKFIQCDGCFEMYGVDNRGFTIKQQRDDAHSEGWVTRGSKDYCPNCKNKIKEAK